MTQSFYEILGVDKSASIDEIKKAYRKLAIEKHPDHGGDVAEFQRISEAYETLKDPNKRAAYDTPQTNNFRSGFNFEGVPPGFEDLFANFHGGIGRQFEEVFGFRPRYPKNYTLNLQAAISLEEAFAGKEIVTNIKLPSGKEQIINVKIPAGIQDGMTLRLQGIGDTSIAGAPPGDIHISIHVHPHTEFRRNGDNLEQEITIDAFEAMLGVNKIIKSIDGQSLNVAIAAGTQPNTWLKFDGYGMPNLNDKRFRGAMLVNVKVTIPVLLTESQKELIHKAKM